MKGVSLIIARRITSLVLCLFAACVAAVCFLPEKTVYLSGKESYSPYFSGRTDTGEVALMINVYENTEVVDKMLDFFKEKGVSATFFVGGCWADDNAETLKRIVDEGHCLGNHGYFHKDHKKLDYDANADEIKVCGELIYGITGSKATLFAPPSGAYSVNTLRAAEALGYKTIMWTLDTIDWRDRDENKIFDRATKNVKAGDFVLMHPKKETLNALEKIINNYKEKGLGLSTVARLINA